MNIITVFHQIFFKNIEIRLRCVPVGVFFIWFLFFLLSNYMLTNKNQAAAGFSVLSEGANFACIAELLMNVMILWFLMIWAELKPML